MNSIDNIYIIHHQNKWGVYKRHSHRSLKNFKHRDLAFHYATRFDAQIIVMTKDGDVDFTYINTTK